MPFSAQLVTVVLPELRRITHRPSLPQHLYRRNACGRVTEGSVTVLSMAYRYRVNSDGMRVVKVRCGVHGANSSDSIHCFVDWLHVVTPVQVVWSRAWRPRAVVFTAADAAGIEGGELVVLRWLVAVCGPCWCKVPLFIRSSLSLRVVRAWHVVGWLGRCAWWSRTELCVS